MSNTDWDSKTVIGNRGTRAKVERNESSLNAARRAGAAIDTERKFVHFYPSNLVKKAFQDGRGEVSYTESSGVGIIKRPQSGLYVEMYGRFVGAEHFLGVPKNNREVLERMPLDHDLWIHLPLV
ncbi:hypothetical protein BT69DRAFT_1296442 [Atractiella rhizophila]|nr:hypothetical protein BT69DRAFT_1296442 [Atractiella rhizophila]